MAQKKQFADLVSREGEGDVVLGKPGQHLAGSGDFQIWGGLSCRWGGVGGMHGDVLIGQ